MDVVWVGGVGGGAHKNFYFLPFGVKVLVTPLSDCCDVRHLSSYLELAFICWNSLTIKAIFLKHGEKYQQA